MQCILPSVKYAIDKVLAVSVMGFSLGSSEFILETAGPGSVQYRSSFWWLLTKGTSEALLQKPDHVHKTQ